MTRLDRDDKIRSRIQKAMKRHRIESAMLTINYMERWKLITKKEMLEYCSGKFHPKESINDDLESFFEDLRLDKKPTDDVVTYFLPSLTDNELELVEQKDPNYFETFALSHRSDAEVLLSKSE